MAAFPSGTVTFLFTDIEGSTKLLRQLGDEYAGVLSDHRRILREAFGANGGTEVDTRGDALFYSSRAREPRWPRRSQGTVRSPRTHGRPTPRCACGLGCTPANRQLATRATSA